MDNEVFLDTPLCELDEASELFRLRSALMGYRTLREIIQTDRKVYQNHADYTQRWFNELVFLLRLFGRDDLVRGLGTQATQGHQWN